MSDQERLVDNFVGVTGVEAGRARFYLESAGWDLELAMGNFYEGDPDDDDIGTAITDPVLSVGGSRIPAPVQQPPGPSIGASGSPKKSKKSGPSKPPSRFATIDSMRQAEQAGHSDSSSEEEGQAFYAGGSETSGQQIMGPGKKKNVVENLFKSAKDHGAEEVQGDGEHEGPRRTAAFRGSGYRLGDNEVESPEVVHGQQARVERKKVDCVLKLWKNGFSVDDGPLRDFKDPQNKDFLESVSNGEVPRELTREARGGEVNLNMEDHRNEEYIKPKLPIRAFTGEGHTLGSPVPTLVTSTPAAPPQAATGLPVKVDASQPSTSIQIRLADGTRIVGKFNLSHRVSDIRRHINASRPQYEGTHYILQTTFPNRELTNDTETLDQAKLANAVVVQRLK